MPIPKITQTFVDGALGLVGNSGSNTHIKIGVASSGTVGTIYAFSDPALAKSTLGTGPLVDAVVFALENAGGPVYAMRCTGSTAGSIGSVNVAASGGSLTGAITVTGTPLDAYDLRVEITTGSATLTSNQFRYSLDGGNVFSAVLAVPGVSYAVPGTGLTIGFTIGTGFDTGDAFTCSSVAPKFTVSDLNTALDSLRADQTVALSWVHVVGTTADAASLAVLGTAVESKMLLEEQSYRYLFALLEAPEDTDANLKSAFASFAAPHVAIAAGYANVAVNGKIAKRSAAWPISNRIQTSTVQQSLGRTRSGALAGVTKLYRDEAVTEGLNDARFITLRTHARKPGFYITQGWTMASPGSDYSPLENRRVVNLAAATSYDAMFPFIEDDTFRIITGGPDNGKIDPVDARSMSTALKSQLRAVLLSGAIPFVSSVDASVRSDVNILSTRRIPVSVRIVPKGKASFIDVDLGFENPALAAAVA